MFITCNSRILQEYIPVVSSKQLFLPHETRISFLLALVKLFHPVGQNMRPFFRLTTAMRLYYICHKIPYGNNGFSFSFFLPVTTHEPRSRRLERRRDSLRFVKSRGRARDSLLEILSQSENFQWKGERKKTCPSHVPYWSEIGSDRRQKEKWEVFSFSVSPARTFHPSPDGLDARWVMKWWTDNDAERAGDGVTDTVASRRCRGWCGTRGWILISHHRNHARTLPTPGTPFSGPSPRQGCQSAFSRNYKLVLLKWFSNGSRGFPTKQIRQKLESYTEMTHILICSLKLWV